MIRWDLTEAALGSTEATTRWADRVIVECACGTQATVLLRVAKKHLQARGHWRCHQCAVGSPQARADNAARIIQKWQQPEYRETNLAAVRDPQERQARARRTSQLWLDSDYREQVTAADRRSAGVRADQIAAATRLAWLDQAYRERNRAGQARYWANPANHARLSAVVSDLKRTTQAATSRNNWANPAYRIAVICGLQRKWREPLYRLKMAIIRAYAPRTDTKPQLLLYQYLDDLGIHYQREGPQTRIGFYVFDCLVPARVPGQKHLLIEVQGNYWHDQPEQAARDCGKFTTLERYHPEYELMYLWEHEFATKEGVLDRLRQKLGLALETVDFDLRQVEIRVPTTQEVRSFLDAYHYIGRERGGKVFGAYLGSLLIGCVVYGPLGRQNIAAQFGAPTARVLELARFCIHPRYHKKNFASWLIARTIKQLDCDRVVAYADTTVGHTGTIYRAAGFTLHHEVPADYWYVGQAGHAMHKQTLYRRAVNLKLTEAEFARRYGFQKQWGGKKRCYVRAMKISGIQSRGV